MTTASKTLTLESLTPIFTVNDVRASVKWYTEVLGLTLAEEWKHDGKLMGASLKAGDVTINVGQDDFAKGRDRKKGVGLRLYCTTDQDVDTLAATIKSCGGTLESEPTTQPWGARDFSIVDPDGFKISIVNAS